MGLDWDVVEYCLPKSTIIAKINYNCLPVSTDILLGGFNPLKNMNVSWDSCSEKKGKAQNVPNSKPPSSNNQHSSGKMAHGLQVEPRGLPKPGDVGGDTKTRGDKKSGKSSKIITRFC